MLQKTIQGQFTNTQGSLLSSPVLIDTTISNDDEILWSPCIGSDGYGGLLNVNLRFVLHSTSGSSTASANPYGYFGGHVDAKAGINVSTTEDWVYAWREC